MTTTFKRFELELSSNMMMMMMIIVIFTRGCSILLYFIRIKSYLLYIGKRNVRICKNYAYNVIRWRDGEISY